MAWQRVAPWREGERPQRSLSCSGPFSGAHSALRNQNDAFGAVLPELHRSRLGSRLKPLQLVPCGSRIRPAASEASQPQNGMSDDKADSRTTKQDYGKGPSALSHPRLSPWSACLFDESHQFDLAHIDTAELIRVLLLARYRRNLYNAAF
jgi:hypothetical protein